MGQLKLVIQTPEPVRLCEYLRRRIGVSARLLARLKRTQQAFYATGCRYGRWIRCVPGMWWC